MPKNEEVCEEQIDVLADRIAKNLRQMGLLEGGKGASGLGKRMGRDALPLIAKRGLVGLRKVRLSRDSNQLTVHDSTPVDKDWEYQLVAQILNEYGVQAIGEHLVLAECDTTVSELEATYYQFIAPVAGRIVRAKLLAIPAGSPVVNIDLHVYSRNPTEFTPSAEERYNIIDVTGISTASAAVGGYKSLYDALHVDSYYINEDVDVDGNRSYLNKLYCNITEATIDYDFLLKLWILSLGW